MINRTLAVVALLVPSFAFQLSTAPYQKSRSSCLSLNSCDAEKEESDLCSGAPLIDRRASIFSSASVGATLLSSFLQTTPANADFAPGGTLVEYEVGVQVGNSLASKSRKADNSNVIFSQDYYYKFGTAAPFIEPGATDFPKTMPFVLSQQRYEALKKYRERVQRGVDLVASIKSAIDNGSYGDIAEASAPEYSIRPMGLLANNFLASENTGTTNELLLARWYINEIYLHVDDIKSAAAKEEARKSYEGAVKAMNSYLGLLNRVTTPKVGEKWDLL